MSTRSAIIRKTETGTYKGIYCHFDGYVSGVGKTLFEHYQDSDKVKKLIELGDISSLDERVEPLGTHSWNDAESGTTIAYGRDRGKKGVDAIERNSVLLVEREIGHNGYVYVFEDGVWSVNGELLSEAIARGDD